MSSRPNGYGFCETNDEPLIALIPVADDTDLTVAAGLSDSQMAWVSSNEFTNKVGEFCIVPDESGAIHSVLFGVNGVIDTWTLASLVTKLPPHRYQLVAEWPQELLEKVALGWGLASYRFTRYRDNSKARAELSIANISSRVFDSLRAHYLVRDMINTPAADMMPADISVITKELADEYGAHVSEIIDADLLEEGYNAIHAVGRASANRPRLIKLTWGQDDAPLITLVGKGVCFDSGGLDIKPSSGMRYMQKDMGGAAHVLGLALMIMASKLPVRLLVLVGAVENAVSNNAFRPGDVIKMRQGMTVEVDNTDAEGRLVICDLLDEACKLNSELIIDFATLTGAARVAVGTEIAAFFSNQDKLLHDLPSISYANDDPMWPLPLHSGYQSHLISQYADVKNCGQSFGGAISAALFLEKFIADETPWIHIDMMAWNTRARPGRPKGGEAMGIHSVFRLLENKYG